MHRPLRLYALRALVLILLLEAALFITLAGVDWRDRIRTGLQPIKKITEPRARVFKNIIQQFQFTSQASLKNWEEKVFRGKTLYEVTTENGKQFLKTSSSAASSGLYAKIHIEALPDVFLSWWWRATKFPQKKDPSRLSNRGEDDFSARVYVVFPGSNFFNSNVIEYIWDENLPVGTNASSPFSDRVKLFVVESGPAGEKDGGWRIQDRNIYEDYKKLFGKPPDRSIGAIAIMSDSDNTKTASGSDFGDIVIHQSTATAPKENAHENAQ
jgi:hypothetical protein